MSFAGRTAVVTGAAGGMGLNIARDLAAADASVTGIDLQPRPKVLPAGRRAMSATRPPSPVPCQKPLRATAGSTTWSMPPAFHGSTGTAPLWRSSQVLHINLTGRRATPLRSCKNPAAAPWCTSPAPSACAAMPLVWIRQMSPRCLIAETTETKVFVVRGTPNVAILRLVRTTRAAGRLPGVQGRHPRPLEVDRRAVRQRPHPLQRAAAGRHRIADAGALAGRPRAEGPHRRGRAAWPRRLAAI